MVPDGLLTEAKTDKGKLTQLIEQFTGQMNAAMVKHFNFKLMAGGVPPGVAGEVLQDLSWLAEMSERGKTGLRFAAVTHCLCVSP